MSIRNRKNILEKELRSQWNQTRVLILTSVQLEFHHSRHLLHLKCVFVTEIYVTTKATMRSASEQMFRIIELDLTIYVVNSALYIRWSANNPNNASEILWETARNCREKMSTDLQRSFSNYFQPATTTCILLQFLEGPANQHKIFWAIAKTTG